MNYYYLFQGYYTFTSSSSSATGKLLLEDKEMKSPVTCKLILLLLPVLPHLILCCKVSYASQVVLIVFMRGRLLPLPIPCHFCQVGEFLFLVNLFHEENIQVRPSIPTSLLQWNTLLKHFIPITECHLEKRRFVSSHGEVESSLIHGTPHPISFVFCNEQASQPASS